MTNLTYAIDGAPRRFRQYVTPCQRAMGYTMRHPEPEKLKRKQNAINGKHSAFSDWLMQDGKDTKAHKVGAVLRARPCKLVVAAVASPLVPLAVEPAASRSVLAAASQVAAVLGEVGPSHNSPVAR